MNNYKNDNFDVSTSKFNPIAQGNGGSRIEEIDEDEEEKEQTEEEKDNIFKDHIETLPQEKQNEIFIL